MGTAHSRCRVPGPGHVRNTVERSGLVRLSVVIPVLNEEETIGGCLESLAGLERPVDECIVVDNNCTDRTLEIVRSYADRLPVRVVTEPRPGLIWARERGFEEARGDLLGRIDADTRVDPEWSREVIEFMDAHPEIAGVSGPTYPYDVPLGDRLERSLRKRAADPRARRGRERPNLYGANMAVRKSAWQAARDLQVRATNVLEDVDLYLALKKKGFTAWYLPTMLAAQSYRRAKATPVSNLGYTMAGPRTYRLHGEYAMVVRLWLMIPMWLVTGWLIWAVLLPYDLETRTWGRRHIRNGLRGRVSPVH
ncbi:glycosyltransferase [Gordonia aurantiaca]|uniref:glycosyltransferase n=1 Tax=Gordonia sp. B21 TaxID=3151852 RepID=UPI0032636C87